jgi:hypothetical protein
MKALMYLLLGVRQYIRSHSFFMDREYKHLPLSNNRFFEPIAIDRKYLILEIQ